MSFVVMCLYKRSNMRELIYYPSFEIQNYDWIKFALLYLNQLDPIIPESGEGYLSYDYQKIINDTDLIFPFRPGYHDGESATLDALDQLEKIFRHPGAYTGIFNDNKFIEKWKNKDQQTFTLFREKYTEYWRRFCLENKIGHDSPQGLRLPPDIVHIYMTILAQCIADSKGIPPITDNHFLDKFSIFSRKSDKSAKDIITTAQTVIELKLPKNISNIPVDKIIRLRNQRDFKEKQKAIHKEIETYLKNLETNPEEPPDFEKQLGSILKDFSDDIAQIGTGTVAFGLGVWLLFQSSGNLVVPALEKLAGGTVLTVGSVISIRKTWKNTKNKRMARRYLGSLATL